MPTYNESESLGRTVVSRYHHRAITLKGGLHQNMCVGQNMNNDINNPEAYRAAFVEATEELKQIFGRIEQLHLRKVRIKKAMEVLENKIGTDRPAPNYQVRHKTHLPGLTVVTRLTVVPASLEAEK